MNFPNEGENIVRHINDMETNHAIRAALTRLAVSMYAAGGIKDEHKALFEDLLGSSMENYAFPPPHPYTMHCDPLGDLYERMRGKEESKRRGAFYTPLEALYAMRIKSGGGTVCDPCCGSGRFLLALPDDTDYSQVYAYDIDEIAVCLARINLVFRKNLPTEYAFSNIRCMDWTKHEKSFDAFIGNPPWGAQYPDKERSVSFLNHAMDRVSENGTISFLLPEAILSRAKYASVQKRIKTEFHIREIRYWDNGLFSDKKVLCPCVWIVLQKSRKPMPVRVYEGNEHRYDCQVRQDMRYRTTDKERSLLQKIESCNSIFLKGNAKFAMGIVTGDNKAHLSNEMKEGYEPVLTGKEIEPFSVRPASVYITKDRERMQQTAPEEMYRAKERIVYRFVQSRPVAAVDTSGIPVLNSVWICIPQMTDLPVQYITAILNCSVTAFYYNKKFGRNVILRSCLEKIPIPIPDKAQLRAVLDLYEENRFDELDRVCCSIYQLSRKETEQCILASTNKKSLKRSSTN